MSETTERDELVERALLKYNITGSNPHAVVAFTRGEIDALVALRIEHSAAREAALCGALKPFAKMQEVLDGDLQQRPPEMTAFQQKDVRITYGDLRNAKAALSDTSPAASRLLKIESAFESADDKDWDHLFQHDLADSGHGQFWRGVLLKVREALLTGASK